MKARLFMLAAILLFSTAAIQAQVGILGGINFQNLTGKDVLGHQLENEILIGFHAGANVNIPIAPDFYFQPGVLFSVKGGKDDWDLPLLGEVTAKTKLSYIEVPLNLLFRPQFGNGHILLGFGPYVGYGIKGKIVYSNEDSNTSDDIIFKSKVTEEDEDGYYYSPFDAGANIYAGFEMSMGLFFQFNAQLGVININSKYEGDDDESSTKNTGFGLSAGFRF